MASSDSKLEKVHASFQVLSSLASSLNAASDEFIRVVTTLDEALGRLNVGLTVWVTFRNGDVPSPYYDRDQIGYCKVNGKWGIALRHIWRDRAFGDQKREGPWLFNDAPRGLRLEGVDKLPDVVQALGEAASDLTNKLQEKTRQVRELANAIGEIPVEPDSGQGRK